MFDMVCDSFDQEDWESVTDSEDSETGFVAESGLKVMLNDYYDSLVQTLEEHDLTAGWADMRVLPYGKDLGFIGIENQPSTVNLQKDINQMMISEV